MAQRMKKTEVTTTAPSIEKKQPTANEMREWYENGQIKAEGTYKAGEKEGEHKTYTAEGALVSVSSYKTGKPDGVCTEYSSTSRKPISKTEYAFGEIKGKAEGWYESGQPSYLCENCTGENIESLHSGTLTKWHANGQKSFYGAYQNEKPQGAHTKWFENGQKSFYGLYTNGQPNGEHTEWYENGKVQSRFLYKNGELVSNKQYAPDGTEYELVGD